MTGEWEPVLTLYRVFLVETGRRYATCKTQLHYLNTFARSHPDPWAVSSRQASGWLRNITGDGARRNATLSLRMFYAWAVRRGDVAESPAPAAKKRRAVLSVGSEFPEAWADHVVEFGLFLRASGRSVGTVRTYRHWLGVLARLQPDPFAVTPAELLRWMGSQEWTLETRKGVRSAVRTFYNWAVFAELVAASPADRLPTVRSPRAAPKPTPETTLADALRSADDKTRLMLLLGAYGGLRAAEIARVRFSDIVDDALYVTGKGGHQRIVPLHPLLHDELATEQARRRGGGHGTGFRYGSKMTAEEHLFPGTRADSITPAVVTRILSRTLGGRYTAHTLRHRFASRAYAGQRDLRAVQELLGHSKPETTARYTAVPDGAARQAVLSL